MKIFSPAFMDGEEIPEKYSYDGGNLNPPLIFEDIPPEAKSLVLIMDDPDAPGGTFTHWILYDLAPPPFGIDEGAKMPGGKPGTNDYGTKEYGGPKPPSGTHRYFFKIYALDQLPDVYEGANRSKVEILLQGHVIAEAQLMGTYTARN